MKLTRFSCRRSFFRRLSFAVRWSPQDRSSPFGFGQGGSSSNATIARCQCLSRKPSRRTCINRHAGPCKAFTRTSTRTGCGQSAARRLLKDRYGLVRLHRRDLWPPMVRIHNTDTFKMDMAFPWCNVVEIEGLRPPPGISPEKLEKPLTLEEAEARARRVLAVMAGGADRRAASRRPRPAGRKTATTSLLSRSSPVRRGTMRWHVAVLTLGGRTGSCNGASGARNVFDRRSPMPRSPRWHRRRAGREIATTTSS